MGEIVLDVYFLFPFIGRFHMRRITDNTDDILVDGESKHNHVVVLLFCASGRY